MVESSKILTVSYGTFSCTLEGFEDSFSTMKAIAEYFRDLAAEDRYFGAEPPTPDAEMLTRIAEREISRRVEARSDENGIVLRAAALPASHSGHGAQPMPPAAQKPAQFAPENLEPVHNTEPSSAATAAEEENTTGTEAEGGDPSMLAAADPVVDDSHDEANRAYEAEALEEMDEAAESPVSFEDMGYAASQPIDRSAPESVAAKLQRIRSVVGGGATTFAPVDTDNAPQEAVDVDTTEDGADDISEAAEAAEREAEAARIAAQEEVEAARIAAEREAEAARIAAEEEAQRQAEEEAEAARIAAEEEAQRQAEEEAEAARIAAEEEAQRQAEEEAEAARIAAEEEAQRQAEEEAEAARIAAEEEAQRQAEEEAEAARIAAEEEAQRQAEEEAEAARIAAEEEAQRQAEEEASADAAEAAVAEEADNADQTTSEADPTEGEAVQESKPEGFAARILRVARLKASKDDDEDMATQDGAHDLVEFDGVKSEELSPEDEAELQEELADAAREASQERAHKGREALPETDDAAMSRILDQTDAELSEPEGNRRRQAIAQLKAAVAATEAARQLGEGSSAGDENESQFRDDLNKVVRPRPATEVARTPRTTERPRPAPLKLVASQRINGEEPPQDVAPVQPRRVSTASISDASDHGDFAAFAAEMGATELPDLLEAAAAYTAYVEGIEDFSRPQIMKKVQLTSETEISREDSLRSFGTLLREGRINKVENGRFQVSEETRFKPEAKAG